MSTHERAHAGRPAFRDNLLALRSAQKPSRGTAAYSRLVNRPLGRLTAAFLHVYGVTPNTATAISAALSTAGILVLCLWRPSIVMSLTVAVLLAAAYVLDSVDGQLARLRGGGSVRGEWLDHTIDCGKVVAVHLAVAVSWYRFPPIDDEAVLLVPLGFTLVQSVTYFGLILMPYLRKTAGPELAAPKDAPSAEHRLRKWMILPTDYGFLCWTFLLIAFPLLFVFAYTALFTLAAALLVIALRKWWYELGAIDTQKVRGQ